jgi:nitrous oxide reductase accessory protein NosL
MEEMIRKLFLGVLILGTLLSGNIFAKSKHMMYQAVPMSKAKILQSGKDKAYCANCGMTLRMFYKTNHSATVNGKVKQYCSMHCLAEDAVKGLNPKDIKVVDNTTLKFIPANKAYYVVGSKKPATMSKISKYAFGTKEAALKFAKEYSGKVISFNEAFAMAKKAYKKEAMMISKKQHMMAMKGKMMFEKKCKAEGKLPKFGSTAKAKAYIKKSGICGKIMGKPLQAIGLYLSGH